ncbi:MAG TPA: ATP-dependent zinc metalloprotease FtsH [Bacillota bacterium]|nr:ATP-dependent zinc metalloprotease FtsH [Bacillota bacterium]HOP68600.1 ATP-dependent zinc metalloprotease FtsH [Bacillota bacterium]HPT33319.1 ATP-dependent zinc metalloprotease FtsH [Bacillota bacterium]HPZ64007.1 ATP-dependent zinc metalloprotease FtsH [Bacillota bacterium]
MNPFFRQVLFYLFIIALVIAILSIFSDGQQPEKITYDEFIQQIEADQVKKVVMDGNDITATLKNGRIVSTYRPEDHNLTGLLLEKDIEFEPNPPPGPKWWQSAITYLFPILLLLGIFFFFMQQTQGGGNRVMNFGKSRARLHDSDRKRVTFDDVAGADEEKAELAEVVDFLKDPKKYIELGARIPKGILLVGPPGTGKTLLARAVAGEAGVPFFSISGSDFVEMFVGVGASRVRDLFETAKKNSPCIVFIDEIDAVGRQRGAGLGGGHDEREQTLNQLLVEMDGFDVNEGIIILAATNRPDILDPALLRPGRFDREITVGFPDVKGREEILRVHARNKPLAKEVDLKVIARGTPGFTGADLENVLNEAALLSARANQKYIGMSELEEAIERVIGGTKKTSRIISDFEKKIVAFHEAGHALVGYLLPHTDPVHKVSIIPRGRAGGYTLMLPEEDRYYMTRSELLDRVSTLLAGRVAEKLVFNEISTGAQNDLERATSIVRQMIMEYGMSEVLGPITLGKKHDQVFLGRDLARDRDFSEEIAKAIDQEIRRIIDMCYQRAQEILETNRDKLEVIAEELLRKETLDAKEIEALVKGEKLADAEPEAEKEPAPQQEEAVEAEEKRKVREGKRLLPKKFPSRASLQSSSESREK